MSSPRQVHSILIGLALALGAVAASVLTLVYLSLLNFVLSGVQAWAWAGLVGCVVVAAVSGYQARCWLHDGAGASWSPRVRWVGYAGLLSAVLGLAAVAARSVIGSPLFYLATGGALLAVLGQAMAGAQRLRLEPEPAPEAAATEDEVS